MIQDKKDIHPLKTKTKSYGEKNNHISGKNMLEHITAQP